MHPSDDQQLATSDQTGAEREHSEQERDSGRGRAGKSMAYRADRKSGQRDDEQEPCASPEQGERDEEGRERNEERLDGHDDARPVSAAELGGGSGCRHARHSAEIVCGRRSHRFSCDCAYA